MQKVITDTDCRLVIKESEVIGYHLVEMSNTAEGEDIQYAVSALVKGFGELIVTAMTTDRAQAERDFETKKKTLK